MHINLEGGRGAPGMIPTTLNHLTERPQDEQDRLLATQVPRVAYDYASSDDISSII